ncbi:MAG: glycosyltransferase family 2 protein [Candidatus Dormibacteraceae bacterium]
MIGAEASPTLTVVVLTLNEERNISDCLASARDANELVVIDSGSTDSTRELAAAAGARVEVHPMVNFAEQRNYANSVATSDWVLHLDADERATPELMREIRTVTASGSEGGFNVPTLNIIFGAPLRHGGWYPSHHLRLQRRGAGTWGKEVHEMGSVTGGLGTLRNPIVHHSHPDVAAFIAKLNRYTTMEAGRIGGTAFSLSLRAVLEPGLYFLYKYVVQQGFRDGWRGLTIAALLAFYRCSGYLKALELRSRA